MLDILLMRRWDDERSYEFQSAISDLYVETVLGQTSGTTWYITQRVSLTV